MPDAAPVNPVDDKGNPEMEETKTSIDRLLDLLRIKGKSELNSIAVALNVDPRIVENWAKVLENGNMIKIEYEVGRMYLEPLNLPPEQRQNLKTRTDLKKFILEEDLAIERISLEKFSKNIEELHSSVESMSKIYQSKLPNVKKMLAEVDRAYVPLEAKRRNMAKIKDEAEKDFDVIGKKITDLYGKLNEFSSKQAESTINERLGQLNSVLQSINEAETTLKEAEANKTRFFKTMEEELNAQVKVLKRQLEVSRSNTEKVLSTNSKELTELTKSVKEQTKSAKRLSKEFNTERKGIELSRRDLDVLKADFNDRCTKLLQGMAKDMKLIDEQSNGMENAVKSIKNSFGDLSKYNDEIMHWKNDLNDLSRDITTTRTEIIKLTSQLNAFDSSKNSLIETKAKTLEKLSKDAAKPKEDTKKIKKSIKETADEIKKRIEGANDK